MANIAGKVKCRLKDEMMAIRDFFLTSSWRVYLSLAIMGLGQLTYRQFAKGLAYLLLEASFILFMVFFGGGALVGLFTLGTRVADPWVGTEGDNSVTLLLLGVITLFLILGFMVLYVSNVRGVYKTSLEVYSGKKPATFMDDLASLAGRRFPLAALLVPVLGVTIFSVIPIVMMTLIAFTNYGGAVVPPALVDWVWWQNFVHIFTLTDVGPTFLKIVGWNLIWAFLSTFLNYFLGLLLALLINRKCVKFKAFWRAFPILAYAIPGFITLIGFKFMFSLNGPINYYLSGAWANQGAIVDFLGIDSTTSARLIGLFVNAWLSVPTTMLLATGLLGNISPDLYEAADIDGANKPKQFFDITLPYIIFATTPTLISQFIGNFNNFGIFYFLRGGLYSDGYFLSSDTDLLINWLYNLSISNDYYSIGAAISLIIFLLTSTFSLLVYVRSKSYKKEDTYR